MYHQIVFFIHSRFGDTSSSTRSTDTFINMELGFKHGWLQKGVEGTDMQNGINVLAQKQTRFEIIKEGSNFNKDFIPTYNIVIVLVISTFAVSHWLGKLKQAWRARGKKSQYSPFQSISKTAGEETHITRSSSASTIHNSSFVEDGDDNDLFDNTSAASSAVTLRDESTTKPFQAGFEDEHAALLEKHQKIASKPTLLSHLRALLTYQPRPLPVVNKVLPDNATSIFVLLLVGLNIFYMFFRCPLTIDTIFVFSARSGYLFVANLPLLYFLGAKNQPLKFLTGYSYESLNIFHRRLGEIECILALLHSSTMFVVWYTVLRPIHWSLLFFMTRSLVVLGLIAFLSYELLYLTSLGSFRQRWYELFLAMHIVLQAVALPLLWFHHHRSQPYVAVAFAIFALDRLVFRIGKSRHINATMTVLEDENTIMLLSTWSLSPMSLRRKLFGIKAGWKPTEHVFLTVPSLSHKHVIQAHPFTIASSAPNPNDEQAHLRLLIRAHSGFTRDLVEHAKHKSDQVVIRVDGPYGSQHALSLLLDSDLAVVVVGGSGIAVGYPLITGLLAHHAQSKIEEDLEGDAAKGSIPDVRICLIWAVREESHKSWLSHTQIEKMRSQGVNVIVPPPSKTNGRPDIPQMVESWIAGRLGDDAAVNGKERIGVVCSGPEGMNTAVRNRCAAMAAQGLDIKIEVEKYGW